MEATATAPTSQYAKPGSYTTQLSPSDELQFRNWVKSNNIPWVDEPQSDYDMRGFYKDMVGGGAKRSTTNLHFPDTYKTPYHKSFSNESKYATADAPHWEENNLVDKTGKVVFSEGSSQAQPKQSNINLIDPKALQSNGYSSDEINFINEAHKNGYKDEEIDQFLKDFKNVQPAYTKGVPGSVAPKEVGLGESLGAQGSYDRRNIDQMNDQLRPLIAGGAGDIAGTAAAPIPIPGSSLGAYTGTYSVVDALMQYLKQDKPSSFTGALGEGAGQALGGKVIGGLLNRLGMGVKAFNNAGTPDPSSIL
jgi:hypothetical protein